MAGRPPKQVTPTPTTGLVGTGEGLIKYDIFMVTVNRSTNKKGEAVTKSVEIGKRLRQNVKISEETADLQNGLQDWQNKTGMGQNIIQWHFPAGSVRSGLEYACRVEFVKDDEGDDTNNKMLVIDTTKCLTETA